MSMEKPIVLLTAPVATRSGYGNHARDIARALIEIDEYDFKINSVPWGNTPRTALEDGNEHHEKIKSHILQDNKLTRQPDLHLHLVIPPEFTPIAKKNVGFTAGIETSVAHPTWIQGCNKMDLTIFTSKFAEEVFKKTEFDVKDQPGKVLKLEKESTTLFEGIDTEVYYKTKTTDKVVIEKLSKIDEDFCFLFVGHWIQGGLGKDRKDVGMLIKTFYNTFKNKKNSPALVLKTSGASFSLLDREDILKKIKILKDEYGKAKLPNIYLLHGDFTDEQMNELYNHDKIKAHISFTHGEGFGRPLLEAAQSAKPVIAPVYSGQADFLQNYSAPLKGSLVPAPKDAFNSEWFVDSKENRWFTVNYLYASQLMKDMYNNYDKYLVNSNKLQIVTSNDFSYEKMRDILKEIVDKMLKGVPKKVELKLPKLQKVGDKPNDGELKLPKLKRN